MQFAIVMDFLNYREILKLPQKRKNIGFLNYKTLRWHVRIKNSFKKCSQGREKVKGNKKIRDGEIKER